VNVAFRVDAGPGVGIGHFMRCLCLADHLREAGASIRVVSGGLPASLAQMLTDRGYECAAIDAAAQAVDAEETRVALADKTWNWLVVDHYALDERWEAALRGCAKQVLAIDDLADRQHDCDLLLDQNLSTEGERRYAGKVPARCRMLLGPRYALLREEFSRARAASVPRTGSIARTFISFGGTDEANWTAAAIEAVVAARADVGRVDVVIGREHGHRTDIESVCRQHGFECHVQAADVATLMSAADLGIGAGGVTMWERCCLGLPALTLAIAANQQPGVREAARRGLVYSPADEIMDRSALARHIACLAENPLLREMLSRNGMAVVDGQGAARVARAMGADAMNIREATADDAAALFGWRNDDSVRRFARRPEPITAADHLAWLHGVLADPNRVLLIGERRGRPAGVVRFDITDNAAEVSIYRVPGVPGAGVGLRLLHAAERWLAARKPHVASLVAEVLGDNAPSHRLFRAAGYQRRATVYEKGLRS